MSQLSKTLHAADEFERRAVPAEKLKGWRSFLGMYAGEHTAGTEFMIGPLFLAAGVSAFDLLAGLLLGNLLAVLSWRFLTAEVATKARFTLYYKLEKVSGIHLVKLYNLANGVLFCFLAGAMITVSATAVGIPFDMKMPALDEAFPNSLTWVLVVLGVGAVISLVASVGYDAVARFSNIAAPWMVLVFLACGIVALRRLEVDSFSGFWNIWGEGSEPLGNQEKFTFWHVVFWSWFCNAAMHIGMSDMSILRYARKASAGWTSAAGMYLGHYLAWIAASLLFVLYLRTPEAQSVLSQGAAPSVAPGPMAYDAVGIAGLICVVVAGWTTANPTIYRAGLAFQALLPRSSRFTLTLIAGCIATLAGLFPSIAMQLLGFVALYGFILAPVGAVIVFEHFFAARAGILSDYAEKTSRKFNMAVLLAWSISATGFYLLSVQQGIYLSFLTLPAWFSCGLLFLLFSRFLQQKPR